MNAPDDIEPSRRMMVWFDAKFLPHLDAALRLQERLERKNHNNVPPAMQQLMLAEIAELRADLVRQVNTPENMDKGWFLPAT